VTDDIVARLRQLDAINCMDSDHLHDGLVVDAADEIERLREECSQLRQRVTMLAEAAAEDARRMVALERMIAKKEPIL
jgi:hypothetical protein